MGDRVRLETATPPVLGKEIWADVSLPWIAPIRPFPARAM